MSASPSLRLLGLSGSLRLLSCNTAILQTLKEALADTVQMDLFPLNDIPLFNQDLEDTLPANVVALKKAISESDGVIIAAPEYNYAPSGVIKNALDWASRPGYQSPMKGKPVLIITSSPAFTGGVRAQAQLKETLGGMLARVLIAPEVVIGGVYQKVANGRLTDEASLKYTLEAVQNLVVEIERIKRF